ncbi:hypothetical protein ACWCOT_35780 [Nonomuraea bangladeshensis]|uniref:hypothetical protein n=1 Tax=Nonomuraea bangladeshensis TaxID=404385 RepID=UPI003C2AD7F6
MLDQRNHQGKFAEDYVRVLASAAGLLVYQDDLDLAGEMPVGVPGGWRRCCRGTAPWPPC